MSCATAAHRRCAYGNEGWMDPDESFYAPLERRLTRRMNRTSDTNNLVIRNDIISFRLRCNHPDRTNDVGGAFMPESYYFSYYNFAPLESTYIVNNGECANIHGRIKNPVSYTQRKETVLNVLDSLPENQPKEVIAFFCHGWPTGIQFGFQTDTGVSYRNRSISDVDALAEAIARIATADVKIILYACSAGADDNSFAAQLRDRLVESRPLCRIDAHKTRGHSTQNPQVNRFESPAGSSGQMIVSPSDGELWRKWSNILHHPFEQHSTLLWKYSQMTIPEIHEYLESFELQ